MQIKTIKEVKDLAGKKVILRADFNVPLKETKEKGRLKLIVSEATKIKETLPTLDFLLKNKAKVILMSHLGRPEGRVDERARLLPVAERLVEFLGNKKIEIKPYKAVKISSHLSFTYATELLGGRVEKLVSKMKEGDIVLLENTRFYSEELKGEEKFIKKIASLADIYVNNAFAASHRKEGTIVGITKYLPSYAGFLLEKEINALSKLLENPQKPYVAIVGGIKIETKIALLKNLLKITDHVCIGGGLANTFFNALGYETGASVSEKDKLDLARDLLKEGKDKLALPLDVIVGDKKGKEARLVEIKEKEKIICKKPLAIMDIGPLTIGKFAALIKEAQTIVWNGPMGYFEIDKYKHGSVTLGRVIASRSRGPAFGVVGGGETISCLEQTGMAEYVDHISTGGGAMLTFLEGRGLPGIEPLLKK